VYYVINLTISQHKHTYPHQAKNSHWTLYQQMHLK